MHVIDKSLTFGGEVTSMITAAINLQPKVLPTTSVPGVSRYEREEINRLMVLGVYLTEVVFLQHVPVLLPNCHIDMTPYPTQTKLIHDRL